MTTQIIIDVEKNVSSVIELNNGMPVLPSKKLDLSSLPAKDKATLMAAIKIIKDNAK